MTKTTTPFVILSAGNEQLPYKFDSPRYAGTIVVRTPLRTGDYSIPGYEESGISVERKTLSDLIGCLKSGTTKKERDERERFEKELSRLRNFERSMVLIEANARDMAQGVYRSGFGAHSAVQSIMAFWQRYNVPFFFAGNRAIAEYMCHSFLQKYMYEIQKRYDALTKAQQTQGS